MLTPAIPAAADPWLTDPAAALDVARASKRPLLVDFWDPTCLGCLKMLAETFPDPAVAALLRDAFVCLKVDTSALTDGQRAFARAYRLLWTPDLVFLDPFGAALGRRVGFHGPRDFAAVLRVALGQTSMTLRRYDDAVAHFAVAAEAPDMRAEARFWAGVAAYKADGRGDRAVLRRYWRLIGTESPTSAWWTRALASWGDDTAEPTGEAERALEPDGASAPELART